MKVCTFFGHRDCPEFINPKLRAVITDLIIHENVEVFYVGNQGQFDAYVRSTLRQLSAIYPHIRYAVVLPYMPVGKRLDDDHRDTMLPEGIELVHPKEAISWRNDWMLSRSDYAVTYVTHSWGGAARFLNQAKKRGKTIIDLAE